MNVGKINKRTVLLLLGCGVMNFSLGSFYAWSVFVEPLQAALGVSRSEVSSVFSLATICFTLALFFGSPVYRHVRARVIAIGSLLVAAAGLALAAYSMSLAMVIVGYGIIFSVANGFGYNLSLQLVNTELNKFAGIATGIVTACYAVGSVASAPILVYAIRQIGVWQTLYGLSVFLTIAAALSGILLYLAGTGIACPPLITNEAVATVHSRIFLNLWLGFSAGALAGLMVISHAAGIISAVGGSPAQIALGTMFVNIGNVTGRFSGGWLSQNYPVRRVLSTVMAGASMVLLLLAFFTYIWVALFALLLLGFAYGSNASTYPVSVTLYYGRARMAKVFGLLMTAWGVAGLSAPLIAGAIFDATGQYRYAILVAAVAALIGSLASLKLPNQERSISPAATPVADLAESSL